MYIYLDLKLMLLKLMFPASPAVRYTDLVPTFENRTTLKFKQVLDICKPGQLNTTN